jgi:hypothetical protein
MRRKIAFGDDNASLKRLSAIFQRLDECHYFLREDKSFLSEVLNDRSLIAQLDDVSSKLEMMFLSNVAHGTTRSHPIEDE